MSCNEIKLERPLFYNNEFGLRFEIGPTEIGVWADRERRVLNARYFSVALERALSIFDMAFSPSDELSIVYQIFSDGRRRIKKTNYILQQVEKAANREMVFTDHREIYTDSLDYKSQCWRRVKISGITSKDANIKNILTALINTDFRSRKPSVKGECYLVNESKGVVLCLYDDRGMDVVASRKDSLLALYKSHSELLLSHDREKIDRQFAQI